MTSERIVLEPERRQITGISATTCFEMERRGLFPGRVVLVKTKQGDPRRVGWKLSDLQAWIASRETLTLKSPEGCAGSPAH